MPRVENIRMQRLTKADETTSSYGPSLRNLAPKAKGLNVTQGSQDSISSQRKMLEVIAPQAKVGMSYIKEETPQSRATLIEVHRPVDGQTVNRDLVGSELMNEQYADSPPGKQETPFQASALDSVTRAAKSSMHAEIKVGHSRRGSAERQSSQHGR
jgi:hypothetical protein